MIILYPPAMVLVVVCMHIVDFTIQPTYAHLLSHRPTKFGIVTSVGGACLIGLNRVQRSILPGSSTPATQDLHVPTHGDQTK